jgi:hypothetical protein
MAMQEVEIRVKGRINQNWIDWFDRLTITYSKGGLSLLTGPVRDQAELRGILGQLADLGFELISVTTNPRGRNKYSIRGGD